MPSRQHSAGVEPRLFARHFLKNPLPESFPPAPVSVGCSPGKAALPRVPRMIVSRWPFPQAPRTDLSSDTAATDEPPTPHPVRAHFRRSSCAPRPSCGTPTSAAQFVSLPPAAPFPAKCRNFLCLNLGGQSKIFCERLPKVTHKLARE